MSDREDVLAAAEELIQAHNRADVAALEKFWHPDCVFFTDKGFLEVHRVQNRPHQQAQYDAGLWTDFHWEDLRVQAYGAAAVTMGYLCGFSQAPGGPKKESRTRYSIFWIKEDGQWRRVSAHLSGQKLDGADRD